MNRGLYARAPECIALPISGRALSQVIVLHIYRRPDGALVIVPALFQPPIALEREGTLVLLGEADVELAGLSYAVVEQLGLHGYAVPGEVDAATLRHAVSAARPTVPASGEQLPI